MKHNVRIYSSKHIFLSGLIFRKILFKALLQAVPCFFFHLAIALHQGLSFFCHCTFSTAFSAVPALQQLIPQFFARTNPATLALQIRNPYYGNIKIKNNVFYSTKHEGTGQGLYSAQLIAEKYNGIMNVNYENQTFEVRILLTLPTTFS